MTSSSQVLIQQRENGNADHHHRDGDLQSLERDTEQQECARSRTDDRENDRGSQAAAAENTLTDKRQRATHSHKSQSQHVGCDCNVGFDAHGDHDWNCDQRRAASHDADHAGKEEGCNEK